MIDLEKAQKLVKELRICCTPRDCEGCHRNEEPNGCDHLERDAADMIEALVEFIQQPKVVSVAIYDEVETYPNCSVQILKNSVTGDVSVGWWPNDEGGAE